MDPINPSLIDRFKGLLRPAPARTLVVRQPTPARPSEEDILHAQVHKWAADTPPDFDAHIARVITRIEGYADASRGSHAETTYWLGYLKALHDLQAAFASWKESQPIAGNSAFESSPQGGPNGG